jgi:hypothetical protein
MRSPRRRDIVAVGCLAGTALLASCERERPWFAPAPPLQYGDIIVQSTPAGAAIWLDGGDTGHATPDTLREVASGTHVIRLRLAGWSVDPESLAVDVSPSAPVEANFTLAQIVTAPTKVVLLEGFSNVSCIGCPAMAATLHDVMSTSGYGLDRVLLLKYSVNWPQPSDPHYLANPGDNSARLSVYQSQILGVPVLFADGVRAHEGTALPPDSGTLRALIDALTQVDPGFGISIDAVLNAAAVAATVTLTAIRSVDDPDARLLVALVENPIQYVSPPGNQGETEFHWIMRDLATAPGLPLPLAAGVPAEFVVQLTRNDAWVAARLGVVAFVQNVQTRAVLQAGYGPVAAPDAEPEAAGTSPTNEWGSSPGSRP